MHRGYIKLWRKSIDSAIFADPELFKLWCLCLMKASHKHRWEKIDGIREPIKIHPGQFVTGRYALHQDYYPKRKKNQKSPLTIWRWLEILKNMKNLNIETHNKYSIVSIINWESYQSEEQQAEHQNEQQANNRRTTGEQQMNTNKNDKNDKNNIPDKISALRQRYPDQPMIDRAFTAIASTRKNNQVSDSIILAQLEKWDRYPIENVEAGIKKYLDKDFAADGKREEYLLGIIRNHKPESKKPTVIEYVPKSQVLDDEALRRINE